MSVSTARDLMAAVGLACIFAGVWLVAGVGVALICAGVLLAGAAAQAELRGGRA